MQFISSLEDSLYSFLCLYTTISANAIFCYFGDKFTEAYEEISVEIYHGDWYLMPIEVQQELVPVIAITQRNIYFGGYFGNSIPYIYS